jgi:hypothetical protein
MFSLFSAVYGSGVRGVFCFLFSLFVACSSFLFLAASRMDIRVLFNVCFYDRVMFSSCCRWALKSGRPPPRRWARFCFVFPCS